MKTLACVFGLMVSGAAFGNILIPLSVPEDLPKGNQPGLRTCVATKFHADDSSKGTCRFAVAHPCSGRVCPPTYTETVYATSWDTEGNVLADQFCGSALVSRTRPPIWTYAPGFDAKTCYLPAHGYPDILIYVPALGYQTWFGYVSTSTDGAYELLTYGLQGYINQF